MKDTEQNTHFQNSLLDAACDQLGFNEGDLLDSQNESESMSESDWIEKGEWLSLAQQIGVEKVFFVNNNPTVIFTSGKEDAESKIKLYNKIWSMARPLLLFLDSGTELSVYSLLQQPILDAEDLAQRPLKIVHEISQVFEILNEFKRENIESGSFWKETSIGSIDGRADKRLIQDLKAVRLELQNHGLNKEYLKYAHALIGRSIFIRYLEDREIISKDYFLQISKNESKPDWADILDQPIDGHLESIGDRTSNYVRVLSDYDFTYALFKKLGEDFNGDIFPTDENEKSAIDQEHLNLVRRFLTGDIETQRKLFLWAYQFNVIPMELISNIYEDFYHTASKITEEELKEANGTHYTPTTLVDFILSKILTPERLATNPRILDPACGSGIFLVESFRRIVRFQMRKEKVDKLSVDVLRNILKEQIAGIEINAEAVRVTAFSLYLALLHYQDPKDIIKQIESGLPLPKLIYQENTPKNESNYNILVQANAFQVKSPTPFKQRRLPGFEETDFPSFVETPVDIIVGNPPWGSSNKNSIEVKWCQANELPIGDYEMSQAFIWKALDLMKKDGIAGLLVSTGVFFKRNQLSVNFRRKWLLNSRLLEVFNFAHVRSVFFEKAISPFAFVIFDKESEPERITHNRVKYWSVKKTLSAQHTQTVVITQLDLKTFFQHEAVSEDKIWKIYMWGNSWDRDLINWLETNPAIKSLSGHLKIQSSGQGFKESGKKLIRIEGEEKTVSYKVESEWLGEYKLLRTTILNRYGKLTETDFLPVPETVYFKGKEDLYKGKRLLIRRGIYESGDPKGQINARFEEESFCFKSSINAIKLVGAETWEYQVLVGILWSSLARYYYFLTTSNWGVWHHEIYLNEVEQLPVRFPSNERLRNRIINCVEKLQNLDTNNDTGPLFSQKDTNVKKELEKELDEAIFDLYELNKQEKEQIRDLCEVEIDYFYKSFRSQAVEPIASINGDTTKNIKRKSPLLANYIAAFTEAINDNTDNNNWDCFNIIVNSIPGNSIITVLFSDSEAGQANWINENKDISDEWKKILDKLAMNSVVPLYSQNILVEYAVSYFSPNLIIIIKRNEKRLWTQSMARADAEAMIVRALNFAEVGV